MKTYTITDVRQIIPVGTLHSQGKSYWLLSPEPIKPDWEENLALRFVVTRLDHRGHIDMAERLGENKWEFVYAQARHLVTTDWSIEYTNPGPIWIEKLVLPLEE